MYRSYTYIGFMAISSIVLMGCGNETNHIAEPEETEEIDSIDENDDALAQHPDDLNEGETILQNAIFTNESTESYYIELRITNEFDEELELKDDVREINEYVLYDDVIYSREEHLDHAAGVLYTSNDAERVYNYLEDHLIYESEELFEEGTTNLSAWVEFMRNAIERIDPSNIHFEGMEEVNGDPSYKVSVSDEGSMTTFWLEESTFNVRQTETQLHESDQETDTKTTTEVLEFEQNAGPFEEGFFRLEDVISNEAEEGDISEIISDEIEEETGDDD
ncbi:hypothetical protein DH09_11560 [Bacillaceae bacterium JMAK1]|nr:hypothetical protein DH09_11560 [Bacillaceae bacterium JMAK1]